MVKFSIYNHDTDYDLVNEFLYRTYEKDTYPNWLQPRWEYFHYHPGTETSCYNTIGVWKENEKIIGLATHEGGLGEVYLMTDQEHIYLKKEMLKFAQETIKNDESLSVYINDFDEHLIQIALEQGYKKTENYELICQYTDEISHELIIPNGYKMKCLEGMNDIEKFHHIMWRGFNHNGNPPKEGIEWRLKMQSAPNYRLDLNVVIEAPSGKYVSYSGVWFDPINKIGYIEPVCTDPDYRLKGLGKIVVLECIKRIKCLGGKTVYVESKQPFYQVIGFKPIFKRWMWKKEINN